MWLNYYEFACKEKRHFYREVIEPPCQSGRGMEGTGKLQRPGLDRIDSEGINSKPGRINPGSPFDGVTLRATGSRPRSMYSIPGRIAATSMPWIWSSF